ncbi:MAG: lysophospholipid acyltransferase family protein [Gammaproteobacteria bacterium]|nr:lysophospholipid acyltransferase family protein [Gammaproteobacteria bacterium]
MTETNKAKKEFPKSLLAPKYWGGWLVAGILFLLVKIVPYRWLMRFGAKLGWLFVKLMPYRCLVAETNIRLCFENTDKDWQTIYQNHLKSLGKGFFEMSMAWFLPSSYFTDKVVHIGHEDVDKALKSGRGVMFLGMHTTGLDFGSPLLNNRYPTYFMYQPARNLLFNHIIVRGRLRHCTGLIEQDNMRELLMRLKKGDCVWYGCDQDFGRRTKSVFAPFFGVQTFTLPYYAKIAKKTGAAVIPVVGLRDDKTGQFIVKYLPEISVDNLTDEQAAQQMNHAIEQMLDGYEDQYYWVHRRFKTRPKGESDIYPIKPSHLRRQQREAKRLARQKANND